MLTLSKRSFFEYTHVSKGTLFSRIKKPKSILTTGLFSTDSLLASKGNMFTNVIERRSQTLRLVPELQAELENCLSEEHYAQSRSKKYDKNRIDLIDSTSAILNNQLLDYSGNRNHDG
jgi:hypothetical protein